MTVAALLVMVSSHHEYPLLHWYCELAFSFLCARALGLPPVPFWPGHPVFQPVCPASWWSVCRDAICPVFWASCSAWLTFYPHHKIQ